MFIKAKMEVLDIKAYPKTGRYPEIILTDVPKSELNRRPTKDQYSVKFPSYGLGYCTKMFYVYKK